mmetsp:Transcript_30019/g.75564  ORF Transcript_30019/g.75564 Transcript_30019/m.75564 type:complete len:210 (-) Transcript_30019:2218-2847(-)
MGVSCARLRSNLKTCVSSHQGEIWSGCVAVSNVLPLTTMRQKGLKLSMRRTRVLLMSLALRIKTVSLALGYAASCLACAACTTATSSSTKSGDQSQAHPSWYLLDATSINSLPLLSPSYTPARIMSFFQRTLLCSSLVRSVTLPASMSASRLGSAMSRCTTALITASEVRGCPSTKPPFSWTLMLLTALEARKQARKRDHLAWETQAIQ